MPHQTKHQVKQKNNSENPSPLQSRILSATHKIRKSKNRTDVEAITKKINKTSGTSFAINISQLLDKKIITNVQNP